MQSLQRWSRASATAFALGLTGCLSGQARQLHSPPNLPPTSGSYAHVAITDGFIFVAGQVPVDSTGQLVGANDLAGQARQVYGNLAKALRSAGASWDDVVKTTTYVTDARQLAVVVAARRQVLGDEGPPNTLVQVSRLAREEWMIEVEAIAVRRGAGRAAQATRSQ